MASVAGLAFMANAKESKSGAVALDITTGSSEGCGFSGGGWPAAKGWDAVTGVGTPNYEKLAEAVAKLK